MSFNLQLFLLKNRSDLRGNSLSEQTYQLIAKRYINQQVQAYEPWSGSYLGIGQISDVYMNEDVNNLFLRLMDYLIYNQEHQLPFSDKLKDLMIYYQHNLIMLLVLLL